jgi:predicted Zn-dependent peptidase
LDGELGRKRLGATFNLRDLEETLHRLYLAVPDMELTAEEFTKEIQIVLSEIQESRQRHQDLLQKNKRKRNAD